MIGNYRRITPTELGNLQSAPETVTDLLYGKVSNAGTSARSLDIDKSWHAIHFVLTGETWEAQPPLGDAVLGGTSLGDVDVGYGPARYLTPDAVQAVASALAAISVSDFASRFDIGALSDANIYPDVWEDADDELAYILPFYEELRTFFQQAAQAEDAMLLYLT
jgi:hypothetical protein